MAGAATHLVINGIEAAPHVHAGRVDIAQRVDGIIVGGSTIAHLPEP